MERSSSSSYAMKTISEENKTSLWKIRKILKEKSEGWLEFDNHKDIEEYILKNLGESIDKVKKDPIKIKIDDYDTGSQQEVIFGYNHKTGNYYVEALWRMKELIVEDEVGFFYDPISKNLSFSVLKPTKL